MMIKFKCANDMIVQVLKSNKNNLLIIGVSK